MGPKAVAQAFEIADGWLPIFWSPEKARDAFGDVIANAREGFDIAATAPVILIDDVESGREFLKPYYALYIGGMGARGQNFYNDLACRYGYEDAAREIQDLYLDGQQARRGGGRARRIHRRRRARRAEGAARGAPRRVARVGRDLAPRLDPAARGAAGASRDRAVGEEPAASLRVRGVAGREAPTIASCLLDPAGESFDISPPKHVLELLDAAPVTGE